MLRRRRLNLRKVVVSAALLFLLASGPHAVISIDERPVPKREPRVESKPDARVAARTRAEGSSARRRARSRGDATRRDGGTARASLDGGAISRIGVDGGTMGAARLQADAGLMIRTLPDGGVYSEFGVPDLTVPGADVEVPISDTMVVNGMPMRLKAIHSTLPAEELLQYYAKEFEKQGLYVDPNIRIPGYDNPHLTGLDPVRGIAYTVLLTRESKGTTVFLGESHLAAKKNVVAEDDGVPLFPGARSIMRANVEAARSVSYVAKAKSSEVESFYSDVLAKDGYARAEDGTYEKGSTSIDLHVTDSASGDAVVQLLIRDTAGASH